MNSPKNSKDSDAPEPLRVSKSSKQEETSQAAPESCEPAKVCECGEPATMMDFDIGDLRYCDFCGSFEGMLDAMRRDGET